MAEGGTNTQVTAVTAVDLTAFTAALASLPAAATEKENIDRLRLLEELKAVCAGAEVRETVALEATRSQAEQARGVPARRRCRGLAGEVALARRESPWCGTRWLGEARTLSTDLPHTLAALSRGAIPESRALLVVRETAHLSPEQRRQVDARLAGRIGQMGDRELVSTTRAHAQSLDPRSSADRARAEESDRYVTIATASESMVQLSALLPTVQGIAAWKALGQAATTLHQAGQTDGRTRAQIAADLFVQRLTGQETATAVPVEVHLVMTDTALLGGSADAAPTSDGPAWLVGHGPIPARLARDLLDPAHDGPTGRARAWIRRLYTAPETGQLVAMDSRRRLFPAKLRRMVILRDDTCRTPWCDAPIRHVDHAKPHATGGETSYGNGSGLCERCNQVKENPGWVHAATPDHLTITTPTGHTHTRSTPPLLRGHPPDRGDPHSRLEHHLTGWIDLQWLPHAS